MKCRWLDRHVSTPGPYLTLCLTEDEYLSAMRHCKISNPPPWVSPGANATTHSLSNPKGHRVCIVTMKDWEGRDPIEVAGLLIHEAVHIWQEYAESMGERNPGIEQEAYAIQGLSQTLLAEFARRMK